MTLRSGQHHQKSRSTTASVNRMERSEEIGLFITIVCMIIFIAFLYIQVSKGNADIKIVKEFQSNYEERCIASHVETKLIRKIGNEELFYMEVDGCTMQVIGNEKWIVRKQTVCDTIALVRK